MNKSQEFINQACHDGYSYLFYVDICQWKRECCLSVDEDQCNLQFPARKKVWLVTFQEEKRLLETSGFRVKIGK